MTDARLLGTWRSDRRLTLREIRPCADLPEPVQSFYDRTFGRLTIVYRPRTFVTSGVGASVTTRYETIAADTDTVVIRFVDSLTGAVTLRQIHFEGTDRYWIALGRFREWFRRIE